MKRVYVEAPRERVLTEKELRVLWPHLDRLQPTVAAAWRLILLTAQRPGEVLAMRWSELEHDSHGWWWNLPAELTKTNRAHRVPLSPSELPHFTPHDLRRTAATWLGRHGVRPDTIDQLLNHSLGRISRTYNRARYDAEKRQAVILLGDLVERVLAGEERSNVVRIG